MVLESAATSQAEISAGLESALGAVRARFVAGRGELSASFTAARASLAAEQQRGHDEIGAAEQDAVTSLRDGTQGARARAQEKGAAEAATVTEAGRRETATVDQRTTRHVERVGAAAQSAIGPYAGDSTSRGPVTSAVNEAAAEIVASIRGRSGGVRQQVLQITQDAAPRFAQLGASLAGDLGRGEAEVRAQLGEGATRARAAVDEQAEAVRGQLAGLEAEAVRALAEQEASAAASLRQAGTDAAAQAREAGARSLAALDSWAEASDDALAETVAEADIQIEQSAPQADDADRSDRRRAQLDPFVAEVAGLVSQEADSIAAGAQAQGAELAGRQRATSAAAARAFASGVDVVSGRLGEQIGQVNTTVATVPTRFAESVGQAAGDTRQALTSSVADFVGGLETRVDEEAAGWATERETVVADLRSKVDEGLAPNEEAANGSREALARVASEAHDEAHASLLDQIVSGIAGAVKAFVVGLLAIAFVALLVFAVLVLAGVVALSFKAFLVVFAVVGLVALVVFGVMAIVQRWEQMRARLGADAPWWALTLGFLGAVAVGVGDVIGITPILEGIWGQEAITGRELSAEERAFRITFGVLSVAALLLLRGRGGRAPAGRGGRGGVPEPPGGRRPAPGRTRPPVEERPPGERTPAEERPPGRERTPTEELPGACFLAGTLVLTAAGPARIEDIADGDRVVTRRPGGSGAPLTRPVTARLRGTTRTTVTVRARGGRVHATPGHPFSVAGSGWVAARDLLPGTTLEQLDGEPVVIEATDVAHHDVPLPTYNLSVEELAAYYVQVADRWVLVHNITLEEIQGVIYWLLGANPRVRETDVDGMSIWRTDNREQARAFWQAREAAGQGKSNHGYFTEAQFQAELAAKGLEAPRTPGHGPLADVLPDGHHSVRPAGTSTPGPEGRLVDLDAAQMQTLTEKAGSLQTSGKTKFNPTVCG